MPDHVTGIVTAVGIRQLPHNRKSKNVTKCVTTYSVWTTLIALVKLHIFWGPDPLYIDTSK